MKVILSRKGFDSEYGGQPSPILPDRTLLSLPIPEIKDKQQFRTIHHNGKSYFEIIKELKPRTRIQQEDSCHLDPDLRKNLLERKPEWKGLFGQSGSAAGHLKNNNVGVGDIFLFFGWFREAEIRNGYYQYKEKAPDIHVIFGYLEIGAKYEEALNLPDYAANHPHTYYFNQTNNTIYEATKTLSFNSKLPGWGCLKYSKDVQLSKDGKLKSHWNLPEYFREVQITYHPDAFKEDYFQSAYKGQEFIITENSKITKWAKNIIIKNHD